MALNPLNAELNSFSHLLALLGAHHILHVSRIRVKLLHSLSPPASVFGFKLLGFITSYIKFKRESDQRLNDHMVACEVSVSLLCTSYVLIVLSVSYTLSSKDVLCSNILTPKTMNCSKICYSVSSEFWKWEHRFDLM